MDKRDMEFIKNKLYGAETLSVSEETVNSNVGIMVDGNTAGKTLKKFLLKLTDCSEESKKSVEALATFGVQVFDFSGNPIPVNQILEDLRKGIKKFTDKEKQAIIMKIFGEEISNSALVLLNEMDSENSIKKNIKVKCISGFKELDMKENEIAEVLEGNEYEAELYEETDEYFSKDHKGREFLVGELRIDCLGDLKIKLGNEFELIE